MKLDITAEEFKKRVLEKMLEITEQDKEHILSPSTVENMATSLVKFNYFAAQKFILGQVKHGGKLTDRNLDYEIRMEHIDMFWYLEGGNWIR